MSEELVKELNNGNETPKIIEPSEKEPCIDAKPMSKRQKCLDETEKRLTSYSGLSRGGLYVAGVVLLVLIILFITVVILASTWPTQPHHQLFPICKDSSCLRAAAQIQESFNSSISPCTNIWEFACGGWLAKHTLPSDKSSWSTSQQLDFKESVRVRDLITTLPLPLRSGMVERKMKLLYDACTDVNIINTDGSRPLETLILELGGWAILRNWNIDEFDINSLLRTLHIKYGVSPYFKISVQPNPRQPGSSSITISPNGLGLPDRSYYYNNHYGLIQNAYKQFIRDILINLSVTTTEAKKFAEDMFNYEKRIAEITPHSHTLLNPVHTYNSVKISELKITAASLPLEDILIEMFPESNITEETEVIVTSLEYLTEISRIVTTTDKEIINSYIMWTLVKKYVPYLSIQFTSTLNNFNSELLGFQKPIQPWEKCAKLIKDVMGFAVESLLELQYPIKNDTKNIIGDVFKRIRKTVQENLKNYPVSSELSKYLNNKLEGLKLQVGLPDIKNDEHFIKDYYNKLNIIRTAFFSCAKNNFVFLRKLDEQLLVSKNLDLKMISQIIKYPQEVKYLPSLNTVIVPRSVLTENEFEDGYPISVMYGKLGIKIANAVVSSILPYDSAWNFNLKLLSPFHFTVNESYNSINNQNKCLVDFLINEKIVSEEIAHLTSLSTLKHVIAVKIAYEALNQHLLDLPHIHQPSLEKYEDSAIFFLAFAQEQCSISTDLQELFNNYVQYELSQKLLLQVVWSQFPEFSNSFDCKTSDKQCGDMF